MFSRGRGYNVSHDDPAAKLMAFSFWYAVLKLLL